MDIERLRQWIGRTDTATDEVTTAPIAALSATLDDDAPRPAIGHPLPLCWHWLYFLPTHRQSELGPDGHARLGGFLPPVPLPRRTYAGGRVDAHRPLRVGVAMTRVSRIADVVHNTGRTGPLVFVNVRHDISTTQGLAVSEDQTIVYRDDPRPDDPAPPVQPAPDDPRWTREIRPDEVLLFRYSALTFNGHRIHYDRRFAIEDQGYGGLVVHGPLLATLLADLVARNLPHATVSTFSFRAVAPLFDAAPFFVCGRPDAGGRSVRLWVKGTAGELAMEATATIATER